MTDDYEPEGDYEIGFFAGSHVSEHQALPPNLPTEASPLFRRGFRHAYTWLERCAARPPHAVRADTWLARAYPDGGE